MKKCPYCAEEIQDKAIKCKHCGEFLEVTQSQEKEEKHEIKENKDQIEYKTMKIYSGLDYYTKYLQYFGWEIIGNQKIQYSSTTTGNTQARQGFFDKKSVSGTTTGNTVYHYYNELSLKRNFKKVDIELLEIENRFFNHIRNILRNTSYSYIGDSFKMFFARCIIAFILALTFFQNADEGLYYFIFIIISILIFVINIFIGEKFNNEIRKRNKNEKHKQNKYFDEIFNKHGLTL